MLEGTYSPDHGGGPIPGGGHAALGTGGRTPEGMYSTKQTWGPRFWGAAGAELTITGHADQQALLEAALLAAVAVDADDGAVLVLEALLVLDVLLDAAAEEALRGGGGGVTQDPPQHGRGSVPPQPQPQYLAALAGVDTVVEAGGNIPADLAEQHHPVQLCRGTGVSGAPGYPP